MKSYGDIVATKLRYERNLHTSMIDHSKYTCIGIKHHIDRTVEFLTPDEDQQPYSYNVCVPAAGKRPRTKKSLMDVFQAAGPDRHGRYTALGRKQNVGFWWSDCECLMQADCCTDRQMASRWTSLGLASRGPMVSQGTPPLTDGVFHSSKPVNMGEQSLDLMTK